MPEVCMNNPIVDMDILFEGVYQKLVSPDFGQNLGGEAQGGLSVAGRCRCLTKDSNTSIEKEGYIPYSLQA